MVLAVAAPGWAQRVSDTVFVSVQSDSGRPLPESIMMISTSSHQPVLRALTDSAGIAKFSPAPAERFTVMARRIGYQGATQTVTDPSSPVHVVLKPATIQLTEVCLTYGLYGLYVSVDSAITSGRARLTVRAKDGSFEETRTADVPGVSSLPFALERAGTYDIDVTARGYEPWVMRGFEVKRDRCHVIPRGVDVRLVPKR